jgi:thiamine kinase-like enzyme
MPRSSLEELALRWVPGEGPVSIQALAAGLVNTSCRVARAGRLYALRVAAPDSPELGLDRQWECKVLAGAAGAGVAPPIRCCEPAEGVLVADWMPSGTWTAADIRQPHIIQAMARLLRRVHALRIPGPTRAMSPAAWIAHYSAALGEGSSALLCAEADARLALLAGRPAPPAVLCHSDLHRFNVAIGERPILLDWEYAHIGDPYWDLAGWIANNDGEADFAAELLASYLERPALAQESARLGLFVWLYDYVCLLWSELYLGRGPGMGHADVGARMEQLLVRLKNACGGRAGQVPAH